MKKQIIMFISALFFFYLIGCFISASFNILKWGIVLRGVISFFGIICSLLFSENFKTN